MDSTRNGISLRPAQLRTSSARIACLLPRMLLALLVYALPAGAHAASVYRCVDAQGHVAYQDKSCSARAQQREIPLHPQPLIGAPGERAVPPESAVRVRSTKGARKSPTHATRARPETSWECRAADGEVFYRHTRCPSSVPGDGVVRSKYAEKMSTRRARTAHNAWSSVPVHGTKVTRAEACRRIQAAGAAGRDGHQRDANVSTYDRLMGRDPCDGG